MESQALLTNDAVIFGILMLILAFVFTTSASNNPFWKKFYGIVPTVLMCYFLPSIMNSLGIIDPEKSRLYFVASRYLLPASLVLLTVSVDLNEIKKLGFKAVAMFLAGTVGIMLGGPLAILLFSVIAPDVVGGAGPDAVWRGMSTIAGSWIGGGANQAAMKEIFKPSGDLFSVMVTVDIIVGNVWLAVLLFGVGRSQKIDKFLKADASSIEHVKEKMEAFQLSIARIPKLADIAKIMAVGFGATAIAHFFADIVAPFFGDNFPQLNKFNLSSQFFWMIIIASALGVGLSFTKFRQLEGVGASRTGSLFLYVLVATIGMQMNALAIFDNPGFFAVGLVWILFHVLILFVVAKLIRAPYFFVAVGSQANVGGAASAPVVASAFHPSLAPVGVLLAVLGYVVGTYGAWVCGQLMRIASGG